MASVILTGLTLGSIYVLVAVGYNIVFITTGAFNFAQSAIVMFGTFLAHQFGVVDGLPIGVVVLLGAALGALIGIVVEAVAMRPVAGKGLHGELVTTMGVVAVLQGVVLVIWGADILPVPAVLSSDVLEIAGGRITQDALLLVGAAVVICLGFWAWFRFSLLGVACLATSDDSQAATLCGINVRFLSLLALAMSGALGAGIAPLVGTQTLAIVTSAAAVIVKSFLALAIGGFGSFPGVLIGGFLVGIVEAGALRYLGSAAPELILFGFLILVLLVKPSGLFGQPRERTV
jgi:branched-chain amino acid transport system permease protein